MLSKASIKSAVIQAIIIILLAMLIGFSFNAFYSGGIPLIAQPRELKYEPDSSAPDMIENLPTEPLAISQEQTWELFKNKKALFLDARKADFYDYGHIPGAQRLTWHGPDSLPEIPVTILPNQLIVTYCNDEDCDLAIELAYFLFDNGFQRIRIFHGGWQEWTAANYPISRGN